MLGWTREFVRDKLSGMTAPQTDRRRLIEAALGGPLADFVAERRRVDGPPFRSPTSWRDIADELVEKTGIEVTHETLRLWFGTETAAGAR